MNPHISQNIFHSSLPTVQTNAQSNSQSRGNRHLALSLNTPRQPKRADERKQ